MKEYFNEYLHAKMTLSRVVGQFYTYLLDTKKAFELNIKYSQEDMKNGKVFSLFNKLEHEGKYVFELLGYEKDIIAYHEYLDNHYNILKEQPKDDVNYYEEYLKIVLELVHMIRNHYETYTDLEEIPKAQKFEDIKVYSDYGEENGKYVWRIMKFKKNLVTEEELNILEDSVKEQLLTTGGKTLVKI